MIQTIFKQGNRILGVGGVTGISVSHYVPHFMTQGRLITI